MRHRLGEQQKRFLWTGFKVFIGAGGLLWVASQISIEDLQRSLNEVSWLGVGGAALLFILLSGIKTLQYFILLTPEVTFLRLWGIMLWQIAISNLVANAAGIAGMAGYLKVKEKVSLKRFAGAFVWVKVVDSLTLSILLLAVIRTLSGADKLLVEIGIFGQLRPGVLRGIGILTTFLVMAGVVIVLLTFRKKIVLRGKLHQFSFYIKQIKQALTWRKIVASVGISLAYYGATLVFIQIFYGAFGLTLSLTELALVVFVLQFVSLVPIQVFGGTGVQEALGVLLLSALGVSHTLAASTLLEVRVVHTILQVILVISLWGIGRFRV